LFSAIAAFLRGTHQPPLAPPPDECPPDECPPEELPPPEKPLPEDEEKDDMAEEFWSIGITLVDSERCEQ
jgi:hypothetical protein